TLIRLKKNAKPWNWLVELQTQMQQTLFFGFSNTWSLEKTKLYKWITEVRWNGLVVIYSSIKLKMAKILDKSVKQTNDMSKKLAINKFKLSTHRLNYFLKHHDISL
ncbi:37711_t:CDS:2, partial [Gigaspora margarita]